MTKTVDVPIPGPRSIRSRIRLALLNDLFLDEAGIRKEIAKQVGGRILLHDLGDQLGLVNVQAAQLRAKLLERAGLTGNRRTRDGREKLGKAWKSLPESRRREIINSIGEHASVVITAA